MREGGIAMVWLDALPVLMQYKSECNYKLQGDCVVAVGNNSPIATILGTVPKKLHSRALRQSN